MGGTSLKVSQEGALNLWGITAGWETERTGAQKRKSRRRGGSRRVDWVASYPSLEQPTKKI